MDTQTELPLEVEGELPITIGEDIPELVESDSFKGDQHSRPLLTES